MATNVTAFTALARGEFLQGKLAAEERVMPADYEMFTSKIPSTVRVETHAFMSALPRLTEFKGYIPSVQLSTKEYTVTNKEYRIGEVQVRKTDLDDDQLGGYLRLIQAIPATGQRDIGFKILSWLAAGSSNPCFDGSNFFASSHVIGSGNNTGTFTAASADSKTYQLIALRCDNPVFKPVMFQDRESLGQLETDAETPEARKKKMFEYWADCRFGLGYGYWWDAYQMVVTNTPTVPECYQIFEQIVNAMRAFTLPKGRNSDDPLYVHEGWNPQAESFVILTGLQLQLIFERAITISQYLTSGGVIDNVYQNKAKVIGTSALTG